MNREEALNFPVSNGYVRKLLLNAHDWDTIDQLRRALMSDWVGTQSALLRVCGVGRKTVNDLMTDLGVEKPPPPGNIAVFFTKEQLLALKVYVGKDRGFDMDLTYALEKIQEALDGCDS